MLNFLTSEKINQGIVPGLLFWRKEKRLLLRRWKRFMLLPETVLLVGVIVFGSYVADHYDVQPGQQAQASVNGVIREGEIPLTPYQQKQIQNRMRADAQNLLSMTTDEIVGALGYSDLKRIDGDMTILQFRGNECILDLYLKDGGKMPVNYEFRVRRIAGEGIESEKSEMRPHACLHDILQTHHT